MINFNPRRFIRSEKKKELTPKDKQNNLVEIREKVLKIIKLKGVVLPIEISKQIELNTMFSGAILSELVSSGKIKISFGKIGGSPLYYVPKRKANLSRLYEYLNEKDKKAYDLLKKQGILNDDDLSPLMSVAIRQIKDFAIPIDVTFKNSKNDKEVVSLWKWYLLDDKIMNEKISNIIDELKNIESKEEKNGNDKEIQTKKETENNSEEYRKEIESEEKRIEQEVEKKFEKSVEQEHEKHLEQQKALQKEKEKQIEKQQKKLQQGIEEQQIKKQDIKELRQDGKEIKQDIQKPIFKEVQHKIKTKQKRLITKTQQTQTTPINKEEIKLKSEFLKRIINYFENNNIDVLDSDIIRKNTESNFIIKVPSIIGKIQYFCKAKNKNKINDKDISAVYIEAQSKKLPVLLLLTGECTKKAKELVEKDLKNIIIKRI